MKITGIIFSLLLLALPAVLLAQQAADNGITMDDAMRSNGKIYVVVAVVTIILTGLILYLVSLDRKISRIEKKLTSKDQS